MTIINQLLALDLSLLQSARSFIWGEYAPIVQIAGELVIFYWAFVLIALWLYGIYKKNNKYKKNAIAIFLTIITIFILYAIINLGIPPWRPGAMEAVQGIAPLIPHPIDNSFPSGHALFTGALMFGLFGYFRNRWLILLTGIIGTITLTARVIGWVHYPGDILAWLIFALIGAYFLQPIVRVLVLKTAPICIRIASWIGL